MQRAVQTSLERFGRLDVMVAHAGVADAVPLLEIDDASWQRIMDVNVYYVVEHDIVTDVWPVRARAAGLGPFC